MLVGCVSKKKRDLFDFNICEEKLPAKAAPCMIAVGSTTVLGKCTVVCVVSTWIFSSADWHHITGHQEFWSGL